MSAIKISIECNGLKIEINPFFLKNPADQGDSDEETIDL
jgi:hypothetical protein